MSAQSDGDTDRVPVLYDPETDEWTDWKQNLDGEEAPFNRLDTLLAYDRHHDLDALVARDSDILPSDDGVPVQMLRIRRRCASAVQSARQDGADDAADALAEIKAIAQSVLESQ